ncbi:MAG: DUF5320 domain-containing protein [Pirellulales bacterium]|nr:DUF5320 domain-containing protein [Pirellulales bacterium]
MPAGDGTGPRGLGPMTGRAAGYCAGFAMPGFMNPAFGRRFFGWPAGQAYLSTGGPEGVGPYGYAGIPARAGLGPFGWFGRGFGRGRGGGVGRGGGRGWRWFGW